MVRYLYLRLSCNFQLLFQFLDLQLQLLALLCQPRQREGHFCTFCHMLLQHHIDILNNGYIYIVSYLPHKQKFTLHSLNKNLMAFVLSVNSFHYSYVMDFLFQVRFCEYSYEHPVTYQYLNEASCKCYSNHSLQMPYYENHTPSITEIISTNGKPCVMTEFLIICLWQRNV